MRRWISVMIVFGLLAVACGGSAESTVTTAETTTTVPVPPTIAAERFAADVLDVCSDFGTLFGTVAALAETYADDADGLTDYSAGIYLDRYDPRPVWYEVRLRVGDVFIDGPNDFSVQEAACFAVERLKDELNIAQLVAVENDEAQTFFEEGMQVMESFAEAFPRLSAVLMLGKEDAWIHALNNSWIPDVNITFISPTPPEHIDVITAPYDARVDFYVEEWPNGEESESELAKRFNGNGYGATLSEATTAIVQRFEKKFPNVWGQS